MCTIRAAVNHGAGTTPQDEECHMGVTVNHEAALQNKGCHVGATVNNIAGPAPASQRRVSHEGHCQSWCYSHSARWKSITWGPLSTIVLEPPCMMKSVIWRPLSIMVWEAPCEMKSVAWGPLSTMKLELPCKVKKVIWGHLSTMVLEPPRKRKWPYGATVNHGTELPQKMKNVI